MSLILKPTDMPRSFEETAARDANRDQGDEQPEASA